MTDSMVSPLPVFPLRRLEEEKQKEKGFMNDVVLICRYFFFYDAEVESKKEKKTNKHV